MDILRMKGTVVLMLTTSIAALIVSASANAEGLSGNARSSASWRHSRQSNSLASSHRLSGNSKNTGTRQSALTLGGSGESANSRVQSLPDEISAHLLGGPSTYEDSYQAGTGYGNGIEAADRYGSTGERSMLPRAVSRADDSANGSSFPGAGGGRSRAGRLTKGDSNLSSLRTKPLVGQYGNPFGGPASHDAIGRIYRSPW